MKLTYLTVILAYSVLVSLPGCKKSSLVDQPAGNGTEYGWTISTTYITGGHNPYPLTIDPVYLSTSESHQPDSAELVFVFNSGENVFIYPHSSLGNEVLNDRQGDDLFSITFCPLTGSGIAFSRTSAQDTMTFRASGYLYHDNLVMLEENSQTLFSQMLRNGVKGPLQYFELNSLQLPEMTWHAAVNAFPEALVFNSDCTGCLDSIHSANNESRFSQVSNRFPGDRLLGIPGSKKTMLYSLDHFSDEMGLIEQNGNLIVGCETMGLLLAFRSNYNMSPVQNEFPIILEDDTGTKWDIFGIARSGDRKGEKLDAPRWFVAKRWAWQNLFENISEY